jgi:hypothetical protein
LILSVLQEAHVIADAGAGTVQQLFVRRHLHVEIEA